VRWTRDPLCVMEDERCQYMAFLLSYVMSKLIIVWSMISYYVCYRNYMYICIYMYIYTYLIHTQCAMLYKNMGLVVVVIKSLIYSSFSYILLLLKKQFTRSIIVRSISQSEPNIGQNTK